MEFLSDFHLESILVNANLKEKGSELSKQPISYETEEIGGYLLMLDTVPEKAEYDYGTAYNRLWSTFIPRIIWPSKPYYGREKWIAAWMAGSHFHRDEKFTGPAISILGATQLNGGAVGTVIVLGLIALMLRSSYEYFLRYRDVPWVQAWWALTYYNAWIMTVNDDPFVWFYYNYGFTTFIPMGLLYVQLKLTGGARRRDPRLRRQALPPDAHRNGGARHRKETATMTTLAVSFTNLGPYHLARLRALAASLRRQGGRLIAYETAGTEIKYGWRTDRHAEPFDWVTLFPDSRLEELPRAACARTMRAALERDRPDAVALCGYVRPECLAALRWANQQKRPALLMSESQEIDHPRVWWKEAIKRRRVRRFQAALVGGPRHRDYLVQLGMPADRITLGYNAVDNAYYAALAAAERCAGSGAPRYPRIVTSWR